MFAIFAVMKGHRQTAVTIISIGVLAAMAAADLLCGGAAADAEVFWLLRLPRTATAILAGAGLAIAGAQMQSILRNPLADPHILGVTAGASLGAAIATMAGRRLLAGSLVYSLSTAGAAFIGSAAAGITILAASRRFRNAGTLLVFGIMFGFIVNALISILQAWSDAESMKSFYNWSVGSFSNTTWTQIALTASAVAVGTLIALRNSKGNDIILFGDEFARMTGASPEKIRIRALVSSCLITGAVTAFCGPIGFVGIVAPHITKALLHSSMHRKVLPVTLAIGAAISLGADLLSQIAPSPLPIASTMAVIGIPVILYILIRKDNR